RELARVVERAGIARRRLVVDVEPAVLPLLLREGYSPAYGARPLKRTVERLGLLPVGRAHPAGGGPPGPGPRGRGAARRGRGGGSRSRWQPPSGPRTTPRPRRRGRPRPPPNVRPGWRRRRRGCARKRPR